jgi:hypothetical protein
MRPILRPNRHRIVIAASTLEQLDELRRRLDPKAVLKQSSAELVLAKRFASVSFGKVDTNEYAVRTLAKGLAAHGGKCRLQRATRLPSIHQLRREGFESMEAQLTKPLAFEQQPILVPVGQQVCSQAKLGALEIKRVRSAVQEPVREGQRALEIDIYARRES